MDWPSYKRVLNMATDDVWASKYLGSDHHVDRMAFAKLDYHNRTGRVYIGKIIILFTCKCVCTRRCSCLVVTYRQMSTM